MPILKRIKLNRILSFGEEGIDLPLEKINLLIGPNGSGKSNLIECLRLLNAAPTKITAPLAASGGISEWLWKGAKSGQDACIDVVIDNPTGEYDFRYRVALTAIGQRMELEDERVELARPDPGVPQPIMYFGYRGGHPYIRVKDELSMRNVELADLDTSLSILAQRKDPDRYAEITYIGKTFESFAFLSDFDTSTRSPVRQPQSTEGANDRLAPDCSNLALVINRMVQEGAVEDEFIENLRKFNPNFVKLGFTFAAGTVQFNLTESDLVTTISPARLSDGTIRWICLLAVLLDPSPGPLVCIEEPELGLHPDVIPDLADLLKQASERTQLIVTTHSRELIDEFSDQPGSVVVCEKSGAETTMKRLDGSALEEWLEDYSLGKLWASGELGGNRW